MKDAPEAFLKKYEMKMWIYLSGIWLLCHNREDGGKSMSGDKITFIIFT